MEMGFNVNQLPHNAQAPSRMLELRVWMVRKGVTFKEIGKALGGITGNAVHKLLKNERIPTIRHRQLVAFGLPDFLLPPAVDVSPGRPAKQ